MRTTKTVTLISKPIIFVLALLALTASAFAQSPREEQPLVVRNRTTEQAGDDHLAAGEYGEAIFLYSLQWASVAAGLREGPETETYRQRLVGKMAAAVAKLDKPRAIPESSEFHAQKGTTLFKLATTPEAFAKVVKEFQDAVNQAPWVFSYHYNLAVAYKYSGQLKFALNSLNLARLLAPNESDRRDSNALRAEIEAKQEMSVEQAADDLELTRWSNSDVEFYFLKNGKVEIMNMLYPGGGKYRLNGSSVEMTFEDGSRASATVSGNKMSVKMTFSWKRDNERHERLKSEFLLTKVKR